MPHILPFILAATAVAGTASSMTAQNRAAHAASDAAAGQTATNAASNAAITPLTPVAQGDIKSSSDFLTALVKDPMTALAPIFAATMNQYQSGAMRDISSMRNSLGAATPNLPGTIQDLMEKVLMGGQNVAIGNAATGAQAQMSSASQLGTLGSEIMRQVLGNFQGQSGQYAAAGSQIASNLGSAPNPFGSIMALLSNPEFLSMFKGRGTGLGTDLFTPKTAYDTATGSKPGSAYGDQPQYTLNPQNFNWGR